MKVIVVGAGIVGANIAYRLAVSGAAVTVVEAGIPGAAASATSYAWLNSNNVANPEYHALRCIGVAAYRELADDLGTSHWLHEVGNLHVDFTPERMQVLIDRVARLRALGYPADVVTPAEAAAIEPALAFITEPVGGAFFPSEGYVDVTALVGELLLRLRAAGGSLVIGRAVALLRGSDRTVTGVRLADGTQLGADAVVLCTGTGADLLGSADVDLSLQGGIGASVITNPLPTGLSRVVHLPNLSIRPDGNGRLLVRAGDVDKLVDTQTMTLARDHIDTLFARLRAAVPLAGLEVTAVEVRTAFRPRPPDGLPVVGPVPGLAGAYLVSLHSGVTLGAILGRYVTSEILLGKTVPTLAPFRADRLIVAAEDDYEAEAIGAGH